MSNDRKTKRYVQLPKPKHKEEYSLEESLKWQPWQVTLKVQLNEEDLEPVDYVVYLRANTPDNASYTAYQVFHIWEHVKHPYRQNEEYPRISNEVPSEAIKIDEQTYFSELKIAEAHDRLLYGGDRRNPTIFRYDHPGWDISTSLVKPDAPKIIVPDKSAIDRVNSSKNRA